jgi:glycine cleavage system H protein
MKTGKQAKRDIYYTKGHEWIDYRGTIAFIGVSLFKLTGFRQIDQLVFSNTEGARKQGERIVTIRYNEYEVEVNMPVDGKIVSINESLLSGEQHSLLQNAEGSAWIAQIIPSQPYDRKDLVMPEQYRMNNKGKHAKS